MMSGEIMALSGNSVRWSTLSHADGTIKDVEGF